MMELDDCLKPYWNIRDSLYVEMYDDGVLMHGNRIIIPLSLQVCVLSILHAAHQGVSGMQNRA